MQSVPRILRAWMATLVFLAFLANCTESHAANVDCLIYASKAVRAAQTNAKTCKSTGPQWTLDFNAHYGWCRTASQVQRDQAEAARHNAQASCRIGSVSQALVNGDPVPIDVQKELGLVSVSGICSGTLLNRYNVLTAVHCITTTGKFGPGAPTRPLNQITVTARWNPRSFSAREIVRYDSTPLCPPNQQCPRGFDIALIMLGADAAELGGKVKQLYAASPREATDTSLHVLSYGRGLATLALAGSPQIPGTFDNNYRSGVFPVREGSEIEYFLTPNPSAQIIGGGDSGGPDFVLAPNGTLLGILGVHSKCWFDYATGRTDLPNGNADWQWAKDIWVCKSDAIHTIRNDILYAASGVPPTKTGPGGMTERGPLVPTPPDMGDVAQREDAGVAGVPTSAGCSPPFVQRKARPSDAVCVTRESFATVQQENASATSRWDPNGAYGPHTCISGNVWREAFDGDTVCVTPNRRAQVKEENRLAPTRAAAQERPFEPSRASPGAMSPDNVSPVISPPENNTDRPGSDYESYRMDDAHPCRAACVGDKRCRAWTFVRAGIQGPTGVCYLKRSTPAPVANTCCVSGTVKR